MKYNNIKYNIIRIRTADSETRIVGSGVLYYEDKIGEYIYLLTAAHCLFADKDGFKMPFCSIVIDVFNPNYNRYDSFTLKDLSSCMVVSADSYEDLGIVRIPCSVLGDLVNSLAEIQIVVDNTDVRKFNTYGYPKANNHQTVLVSPAIWQEWSLGTNQFFLQLQSDMIEGYVQGYSGGGIFLDIDADESLLMGLFARYQMEERGRVIYAQSLRNINAVLSEKRWPEVTISYLGAGGISKGRLESQVRKTIKNLGPNFNPDLNLKTAISESVDSIERNHAFYQNLTSAINGWLHRHSFYNREESEIEKLESEYSEISRRIASLLQQQDWHVKNQIDIFSVSSELQTFKGRLDNVLASEAYSKTNSDKLSRIYSLIRNCEAYNQISDSCFLGLANNPFLVVKGDAGCGKSHLLGDIASSRLDAGKPVLFFLGSDIDGSKSIEDNILQILGADCSFDTLMRSLNSYASLRNERVLILVDAINETSNKKIWKKRLAGFVELMKSYPCIGVVITVRTTYLNETLPKEYLSQNSEINIIEHKGFQGNEQQAVEKFCDYYGIAYPTLPLLNPEYANPLLLLISCKVAKNTATKQFVLAHTGMNDLFKGYRDNLEEEFALKEDRDYDGKRVVSKAIRCIAEHMLLQNCDSIEYCECDNIIKSDVGSFPFLLKELVSEGVFTKEHGLRQDENEYITFSYQRLKDHYMAEYIIADCYDSQQVGHKFQTPEFKDLIYNNINFYGIVEQLAIMLPEQFNIEFWEVLDSETVYYYRPGDIALDSLRWRSGDNIDAKKFISFIKKQDVDYHTWLDILVQLAPIPNHPFNANLWHNKMMSYKLPERESFLQYFLVYNYSPDSLDSNISRLLNWAWSPGVGKKITSAVAELAAKILCWFLCSTMNCLRDRTTKALVNLLQYQTDALLVILKEFRKVDDPYIIERLYAVAYGCILRTPDVADKQSIGKLVYNQVFKSGRPPKHFLLRDYACNIVDYAVNKAGLKRVDMTKVLPPYNEEVPEFPDREYIDNLELDYHDKTITHTSAHNNVIYSVVDGLADFGTKIVKPYVEDYSCCSFRLEDEYQSLRKGVKKGYKQLYDAYTKILDNLERFSGSSNPNDKDYTDKCLMLQKLITPELSKVLGEEKFKRFRNVLAVNHILLGKSRYQFPQDSWGIRRWIVKRVFELGYDKDLHGEYDELVKRHESRIMNSKYEVGRLERIGKKYEWIALWEILGCLADNFYMEDPWDSRKNIVYSGAWQSYWRDCDPACITRRDEYNIMLHWADYDLLPFWALDDVRWLNSFPEISSIKSMIIRTDDRGWNWLTVHDYRNVKPPTQIGDDKWGISNRLYNFDVRAVIIKKSDKSKLINKYADVDLSREGCLLPSYHSSHLITREKYWSKGSVALEEYYGNKWSHIFRGCKVKGVLAFEDMNGNIEGDYSGTRAKYYIPIKDIMQSFECTYADEDGILVDPINEPVVYCNPNRTLHTLFRADKLTKYLNENNLEVIWIVQFEKILGEEGARGYNHRVNYNGFMYFDESGSLTGNLKTHNWE